MSYRITLNRPPVIECDTIDEVLALAEVATRFADRFAVGAEPDRQHVELPAATVQPRITAATEQPAKATPKRAAKAITDYLARKGKAARVSELCGELGLTEPTVRAVLGGPEFLELGRGFFRLADGAQPTAKPTTAPKRRGRPPRAQAEQDDPASDDDADDWEDPAPPRRQPQQVKAGAKPAGEPIGLAEKIRRVLKANGALGVGTIGLAVEQPASLVKDVLRSRPDLFRQDGSGWELV